MFERKNQNVLSEHYSKLIEGGGDDGDEEDFITLKRADHDLGEELGLPDEAADMSKRKQRMGKAKRALMTGGMGRKLIFDEEGNPHEMYEMEDADRWMEEKGGLEGVTEEGRKFAEGEVGKMRVTNVVDKEEAREKKREKKRKRKEREKAVCAVPFLSVKHKTDVLGRRRAKREDLRSRDPRRTTRGMSRLSSTSLQTRDRTTKRHGRLPRRNAAKRRMLNRSELLSRTTRSWRFGCYGNDDDLLQVVPPFGDSGIF
jgi:hypothetical protein